MNPYRIAFDLWHSHDPEISWADLLTFFFHHGAVVSTPDSFILARPACVDDSDKSLLTLSPIESPRPLNCWNVWLAAGSLDALLLIAQEHPMEWLVYCRNARPQLRRTKLKNILRHAPAKVAAAHSYAAASFLHRSR